MKIQDIVFFIIFIFLFVRKDPRMFAIFGIVSLGLSIPLFYFWIFFTAERLTWYAGGFLLTATLLNLYKNRHK